jgi:hypothetical protein
MFLKTTLRNLTAYPYLLAIVSTLCIPNSVLIEYMRGFTEFEYINSKIQTSELQMYILRTICTMVKTLVP